MYQLESVNSKNRYSILSAVNIKGGNIPPVKAGVIQQCTDSSIFLQFIRILLDVRVLEQGDVFIVYNCSVHVQGDNIGTQRYLLDELGILMIMLPPYHPDINPTKLVYHALLQRLA